MIAIIVAAMLERLPDAAEFNLVEDAAAFAEPATLIGLFASAGVAEEGCSWTPSPSRRPKTGRPWSGCPTLLAGRSVGRLELVSGARIWIVWRNYPEDAGIDYYVDDDTLPEPLRLAAIGGHFVGPGFSWPEVRRASQAPADVDGVTGRSVRLLSLLPALGDAEMSEQGAQELSEALAVVGAPGLHLRGAAQFYGYAPTWKAGECSGRTGPRCPDAPHALPPATRRVITELPR
jgi:hypothetical protein